MTISGMFSLLEAVAKMEAFRKNCEYASEAILSDWAVTVRDKAKEAIGTYRYGWPALGPEAVAKHGDTPLLDTGALRDSIGAFVQMHSVGHGRAVVGSNEDTAVWQELGTSRIPPRSFLVSSAMRSEKELGRIARKYIAAAWTSAGHDNKILQLLHAIKLLLEIAHEVHRIGKRLAK
jgi:phage gpG-like protein